VLDGGFQKVWQESSLFRSLREPTSGGACASCSAYDACRGGCMAAKFFTGLPMDGPDPECVKGNGEFALAARTGETPRPSQDHSRPAEVLLGMPGRPTKLPDRFCNESPL
jgi:sulfatase maturation enzyme AslB (radical SAM superfamily)